VVSKTDVPYSTALASNKPSGEPESRTDSSAKGSARPSAAGLEAPGVELQVRGDEAVL